VSERDSACASASTTDPPAVLPPGAADEVVPPCAACWAPVVSLRTGTVASSSRPATRGGQRHQQERPDQNRPEAPDRARETALFDRVLPCSPRPSPHGLPYKTFRGQSLGKLTTEVKPCNEPFKGSLA
jgi:hypothetical protein